jgi:2-oxoglutarate dehydrogenase E2 component (dihydrolipoamide succinyltransferase)
MATQVEVPALGESVRQVLILRWYKQDGDVVAMDEPLCELETDKANTDLPAPAAGVIYRLKDEGDTVNVGEAIARIDDAPAGAKPAGAAKGAAKGKGASAGGLTPAVAVAADTSRMGTPLPSQASDSMTASTVVPGGAGPVALEDLSPAVRRLVEENQLNAAELTGTGPNGRITKEDVQAHLARRQGNGAVAAPPAPSAPVALPKMPPASAEKQPADAPSAPSDFDANGLRRVPMSNIRQRIAETLVHAQQTAAILTTYNEVDLTEVIAIRGKFKAQFEKVHGVGLGFMSFFCRAVVLALRDVPRANAFIDGNDMVYHNYVNLGIAVSTDRGLAVPVLHHVENMSFAKIESEVKRVATAVRDGKLGLQELSGATFTITNGGVFGSLLSTPILTPPQSGILGMHTIQKRPVVIDDKIEIRSMMYVALSYDHRIVDGKEAITFLVRLKQFLEDPARLMLEI